MNILIKIFIPIILASSASAVSNFKGHEHQIQNAFSNSKANLSNFEKKIAGNFHKLLKLADAGIVNKRLHSKLLKDLKRSSTFYPYIIWPQTVLQIENSQSLSGLNRLCATIAKRDNRSAVIAYLNQNAEKICYKNLLSKLSMSYLDTPKNLKAYERIFSENVNKLIDYSMETELKYFLSRFRKKSKGHNAFSDILANHYIENDIVPSKSLLPYVSINLAFTEYIQTKDLDEYSNSRVFHNGYRKLAKEALELADKGEKKNVIHNETLKILKYTEATATSQNTDKLMKSMLSFGKSLSRRKYFESARAVFDRILSHKSDYYNKAAFEYFWTYISVKNYSKGLKEVSKYTEKIDLAKDSKIAFWIGYANYYSRSKTKAKNVFKELIATNPLSYYAILASKIMSEGKDDKDTKSVYLSFLKSEEKLREFDSKNFDHRWLKRILAWGHVYNPTLLNLELAEISNRKEGLNLETHLLSAAYKLSKEENYLESFKIIYRHVDKGLLGVNTEVLKLLFPLPYLKEVINKSKDFDPIIAMSLIRQESGFNRFAKSRVGARGLMQLMPGTARRFKRRVRTRQLYNSNLNIAIGTKYFNKLMKMFDNNLVYSLAADNAGEGRISDWQERDYVNSEDSMLQNIENIPFTETRKYVKLIFRNIFFYKMLTEEPVKKDPFKLNKIYDIHVGFNK